ncbi:hypothetical protein FQN57_005574 [Myotisia sp. PD_48]|nr:hypothetical protein FQN57_005574 [Myotisia sp. PD_48]
MTRGLQLFWCFALALSSTQYVTAERGGSRPRGVGPEFVKFFRDASTFSCISNPSIKIPFSAVNDDYCDCPDGSDEPGTSACSYISPYSPSFSSDPGDEQSNRTLALPGFHCKNKGNYPLYIPFQRVNDGVCDYDICCDGSDEWAQVGGLKCENKCKEIGKKLKQGEDQRQKSYAAALRKRQELVNKAARIENEVQNQITALEVEIQTSEAKVNDLKEELNVVRAQHRGQSAKANKAGKLHELLELAKTRTDTLREALSDVRRDRDEQLNRIDQLEGILLAFKEEYNPNFNDEGVKRAVRSWEDYVARQDQNGNTNSDSINIDEVLNADLDEPFLNAERWEEGETEISFVYKIAKLFPASLVDYIEDKISQLRTTLVSNGLLARPSDDSESAEPRPVQTARENLSAAESGLESTRNRIRQLQNELQGDFGVDSVLRALKGECVTRESGEYIYELCWMDQTKQKSKKGRGDTNMGNFEKIGSIIVDEATSSGHVRQKEKVTLEYSNGQGCWNGPARSTKVILECGENNEITKVTEDEKCVYSMFVTTPVACTSITRIKSQDGGRDEL